MHPKTLQKIKATKKAPLLFNDYMFLFSIVFPLFIIFSGVFLIKNNGIYHITNKELFIYVCLIGVGVIGAIFIYRRFIENFTYVSIPISKEINLALIAEKMESTLKLSSLNVDEKSGLLEAHTRTTAFSWGEKITIIHNGTEILINSRPTGQPATIIKDRLNVRRVKELVEGF